MDQRRAFLDAIIAEPDDDDVRLVYADWLDENGTEADRDRARFIRLQIGREKVESESRRRLLAHECGKLIGRHWREWTHGFSFRFAEERLKESFVRGFLPELYLESEDLAKPELDVLMAYEPVTDFILHFHARSAGFDRWKHLPRVRRLMFSGNGNVKALLRSRRLTGVRDLDGAGHLDAKNVAMIATSPRFAELRRLEIGNNDLGDAAVKALARSRTLSNLTALDFGGNLTTVAAVAALADSPLAGRLTHLGLARFRPTEGHPVGIAGVERLAGFGRLEALDLRGQELGDEGTAALAASPNLAGLRWLDLGWNGLGLRGVAALLSSPHLVGIETLGLGMNSPGAGWVAAFTSAGPRPLRVLSLESNDLDGEAIARLVESSALVGLRDLSLIMNPIGDRGAAALARSSRLTGLRQLNLAMCQIGDEGALALADSPLLDGLKDRGALYLGGNRIRKRAARRLLGRLGYDPVNP